VPPLVAEILALLVYGPALVLLHEVGHAAFARIGGFRVTSFGIGLGPPFWKVELSGGAVVHLDRWILAGGTCTAVPIAAPSPRRAWFHGGGLLVQAGLACVLLLLPETWLVARIAQFNLLVAATNAVPWRWGASASDGWYLWNLVTGGHRAGELLPQRTQLERLRRHAADTGSAFGSTYAELCLAWLEVQANRTRKATRFFEDQAPEVALEPWVDALYHYVHSTWHRMERRPLAALRIAREALALHADDLADESVGLLTLAEAHALLDLEEPAAAQRVLARLAGVGGLIGRQAAVLHLAASVDAAPDELEFATWRVVRRIHEVWLDPPETVMTLWIAAGHLDEHQRVEAARGAREASRTLAKRTLATAEPVDRHRLAARLGEPAGLRSTTGRTGEAGP
jgi:hypothetical protein